MIAKSISNQSDTKDIEHWLVTHLAEVLNIPTHEIRVNEPFEGLGLSSIEVVVLSGDLEDWLEVRLSPTVFWEHRSISTLAEYLGSLGNGADSAAERIAASPINAGSNQDPIASLAQERFWFLEKIDPDTATYNIADLICRMRGRLDVGALAWSLSEIVHRHEALRTVFHEVDGKPVPVIKSPWSVIIPTVDLTTMRSELRESEALSLATAEMMLPFNLEQGTLFRVKLLKIADDDFIFVMPIHHLIADGWSIGVLLRELDALYTARVQNEPYPLEQLSVQYSDFARWQRDRLQEKTLAVDLDYWKNQFNTLPSPLDLPYDKPHQQSSSRKGAHLSFDFPPVLQAAIRRMSQEEAVTTFTIVLAAFQSLLFRYTGKDNTVVGTPFAGRDQPETQNLIGLFINTLPLRADLSGDPTFRQLLHRTRDVIKGALEHQHAPYDQIVRHVQPRRTSTLQSLFQTMFVMQNWPLTIPNMMDVELSPVELTDRIKEFELVFSIFDIEGRLDGKIDYQSDLFYSATISRMIEHYLALLTAAIDHSDVPLSQLQFISDAEKHMLQVSWNDTDKPFPANSCIHHLFEAQVLLTPNAMAVESATESLTYQALNRKANQLARYLQNTGIGPESVVGLYLESSPNMIVGLLAIIKAGGAYLPLDPAYPLERIAYMVADSQAAIVLTEQQFASNLTNLEAPTVFIDADWDAIAQEGTENPGSVVTARYLAYVIYTSGSTGLPKGVQIEHRSLVNFITAFAQDHDIDSQDRIPQLASVSFDVAAEEILVSLTHGATLVLYRHGLQDTPRNFVKTITTFGITVLVLPTAYWHHLVRYMVDQDLHHPQALRLVIIGGEQAHSDTLRLWHRHVGNTVRLRNLYGPTETTIATVACDISDTSILKRGRDTVPIGRPMANTRAYILNPCGHSQPIGVAGELYIGGVGVGRGYLNRPDLNKTSFLPDPFTPEADAFLYRTGDLARYLEDGTIEFLGRLDNQVKLRGFRIELGEIETAIERQTKIDRAVVLVTDDNNNRKRLVSYITANADVDTDALRKHLLKQLPEYMVPTAYVKLDSFPISVNGKIDREVLRTIHPIQMASEHLVEFEYTPTEREVASIWMGLMGVEQVGRNENFFSLGGHSLLALQLSAKVYDQFGVEVSWHQFLKNPTIAGLAQEIDRITVDDHYDSSLTSIENGSESQMPLPDVLVPIHPQGDRPPIFCIHPAGGVVFPYYTLASHLDDDQPLYGVQDPSFNSQSEPLGRIEDLAEYYVESIRAIQPAGPYNLLGWSFGGVVAYEMAQRFHELGEKVTLLGVLDTEAPKSEATNVSILERFKAIPSQLLLIISAALSAASMIWDGLYLLTSRAVKRRKSDSPQPSFLEYVRWSWTTALRSYFVKQANMANIVSDDSELMLVELPTIRHVLSLVRHHTKIFENYLPKKYAGKVTLFRATERLAGEPHYENPETMGWELLAMEGVDVRHIPGNHVVLLSEPFVQKLAEEIQTCVNQEQAQVSPEPFEKITA